MRDHHRTHNGYTNTQNGYTRTNADEGRRAIENANAQPVRPGSALQDPDPVATLEYSDESPDATADGCSHSDECTDYGDKDSHAAADAKAVEHSAERMQGEVITNIVICAFVLAAAVYVALQTKKGGPPFDDGYGP